MTGPLPRRGQAPDPHRPFEELAVGYALSALEPDEQARFCEHLAACARCERTLAEHALTLAQLAHAAPPVEPPASLLEGLRAGMAAQPRGVPLVAPTPAAELAVVRRRRSAVLVRRSHLLVTAAAVMSLIFGLGGWNAALQRDRDQQAALTGRLASTVQTLESEDTRTVPMASPEGEVLAVAVLHGEQMSLVVDGLAPNNDDESVYVVWGQSRYGDVRAVGSFDVRSSELDVLAAMRLEPGVGELTTLMVTHEPGRAAPALTTQPVLVSGAV